MAERIYDALAAAWVFYNPTATQWESNWAWRALERAMHWTVEQRRAS